jgi:hypothetical protein
MTRARTQDGMVVWIALRFVLPTWNASAIAPRTSASHTGCSSGIGREGGHEIRFHVFFRCPLIADTKSATPAYNTLFNKGVKSQDQLFSGNNQGGQLMYTVYQ